MTQPLPDTLDATKIIEFMVGAVAFVISFWKLVDAYFASKKREKQEFIVGVVKATMDTCLADLKSDLHEFKQKTETQMSEFNRTVLKIYTEVKK